MYYFICFIYLPRNGAPFNIPVVVEFKFKSLAEGKTNDTVVFDMAHDILTKPHTNNSFN